MANVAINKEAMLQVIYRDANGSTVLPIDATQWSISDSTLADITVQPSDDTIVTVTPKGTGTVTATATSGSLTATYEISFIETTPAVAAVVVPIGGRPINATRKS